MRTKVWALGYYGCIIWIGVVSYGIGTQILDAIGISMLADSYKPNWTPFFVVLAILVMALIFYCPQKQRKPWVALFVSIVIVALAKMAPSLTFDMLHRTVALLLGAYAFYSFRQKQLNPNIEWDTSRKQNVSQDDIDTMVRISKSARKIAITVGVWSFFVALGAVLAKDSVMITPFMISTGFATFLLIAALLVVLFFQLERFQTFPMSARRNSGIVFLILGLWAIVYIEFEHSGDWAALVVAGVFSICLALCSWWMFRPLHLEPFVNQKG